MKLNRSSNSSANGSVLLVAVGTIVVLGIILAAILALVTQERRVLARTAAWNTALPAADAGIEEAMSHLRVVQDGPRGVNGWKQDGSSFLMTRYLGESRYTVAIDSKTPPTIESWGETLCTNANTWIQRRVRVTTTNMGSFHQGMVARRKISVGGNFLVDSFDSTNPSLSDTNGQYVSSKRSDKGGVASNSSDPGAITLSGGVQIYGSLSTGPTGTVATANNSSVGSTSWVNGGKKGIEPDHYTKDMNLSFDPASLPYTSAPQPSSQKINTTTYSYVLQDGDYQLPTMDVKGGTYMYVSGKARLIVDKDIKGSGGGVITIGPNASLEVYVKKGTVSLTGSSILNNTGKAANFSLTGLSGLTDISISGNFFGTIYAPNTSLNLSGGGELFGAIVVDEINARGNYKFHYDESLAKKKPVNFLITSWEELPPVKL